MDIHSTDLPMEESESNDQDKYQSEAKKKIDHRLQAQMFYCLKTRIDIHRAFTPTMLLGVSPQENNKANKGPKTEKESPEALSLQKKHESRKGGKQAAKELVEGFKMFVTQVTAMDAKDGRLKSYSGPHIVARDKEEAQVLIDNTGLGYCEILGELIGLIDTEGNDVKDNYRDN